MYKLDIGICHVIHLSIDLIFDHFCTVLNLNFVGLLCWMRCRNILILLLLLWTYFISGWRERQCESCWILDLLTCEISVIKTVSCTCCLLCVCNGAVKQGGMLLRPLSWHGFSIQWDQEGDVNLSTLTVTLQKL